MSRIADREQLDAIADVFRMLDEGELDGHRITPEEAALARIREAVGRTGRVV